MGTAFLEMPQAVSYSPEAGTLGAFFGAAPAPEDDFRRADLRLIADLVKLLDTQLIAVINTRSSAEFASARKQVFGKYVHSLRALQDTMSIFISDDKFEAMARAASTDVESDLAKIGPSKFGTELTEQAQFTLWTLEKIREQKQKLDSSTPLKRQDSKLIYEYRIHTLGAQFHLDVLVASMKFETPICEDIRKDILEGLRSMVNAYAILKDLVAMSSPKHEDVAAPQNLPWDQEDEELLASSMRDINADFTNG